MRRIANAAGLLGACLVASTCLAQERIVPPPANSPLETTVKADGVDLGKPLAEPELQVLPIDLATALQLSGSRPIDVQLAQEGVRGASASLLQAQALWLPSITIGGDYYRHDGDIQDGLCWMLVRRIAGVHHGRSAVQQLGSVQLGAGADNDAI